MIIRREISYRGLFFALIGFNLTESNQEVFK